MNRRFCHFVPIEDLERVGWYGHLLDAETRMRARLANVPGVHSVDVGFRLEVGKMIPLRAFVIEMKTQKTLRDYLRVRLAVEEAASDFCVKLAKVA